MIPQFGKAARAAPSSPSRPGDLSPRARPAAALLGPVTREQFRNETIMNAPSACAAALFPLVLAASIASAEEATTASRGSGAGPRARVAWSVRVEPPSVPAGGSATIVAAYETAEGWHIYAPDHKGTGVPARIELPPGAALRAEGGPSFPEPLVKEDPILEETARLLQGKGEIRQPVSVPVGAAAGEVTIPITIRFMACSETTCDPPSARTAEVAVRIEKAGGGSEGSRGEAPSEEKASPGPASPKDAPESAAGGTAPRSESQPASTPHVAWTVAVEPAEVPPGGRGAIVARYELAPGWHLYAPSHVSPSGLGVATRISWDSDSIQAAGRPESAKPVERVDASTLGERHLHLEGRGAVRQPFRVSPRAGPGEIRVPVRVDYMTCSAEACDPAETFTAVAVVRVSSAAAPSGFFAESGILLLVVAMVGGGLLALVMPCTYPMIPLTISYFTKQAERRGGNVLPLALAYGAGIVLVFNVIGWAFARSIGPFAAHPVVNLVFGIAFAVFALSLFGLFEIRLPSFLNRFAGSAASAARNWLAGPPGAARAGDAPGGAGAGSGRGPSGDILAYAGVFVLGTTVVVTSFTCTAPILGALLAFAIQGGDLARVTIGMTAFGTTIAVPFVLLSLFPARVRSLPKAGEWMHTLKVSLGFLQLAAALKFLSNAEHAKGLEIFPRELFLAWCAAIFLVWGLYLFGAVRLKGEAAEGVGPARMLFGLAAVGFAAYLGLGVLGFRLGIVIEALAPPYSAARLEGGAPEAGPVRALVEDDLDAGLSLARATGKRALVNFTGVACVNCRAMERGIFPKPEVARELGKYVEIRLHTDRADDAKARADSERFQDYKVRLTGSYGNPIYVVVDPVAPETPIAVFSGADPTGGARFRRFLEENAG